MPREIALVFAGGAIALFASARLGGVLRRWRARRRARRWRRGETRAEKLLAARGYQVIDRQVTHPFALLAGRDTHEAMLRADFLARRGNKRFVAEAKTGDKVGTLRCAATRRQVLEYLVAYDVDAVLLVDVEAGSVTEVTLPGRRRFARGAWVAMAAALVGALAGAAVTWQVITSS